MLAPVAFDLVLTGQLSLRQRMTGRRGVSPRIPLPPEHKMPCPLAKERPHKMCIAQRSDAAFRSSFQGVFTGSYTRYVFPSCPALQGFELDSVLHEIVVQVCAFEVPPRCWCSSLVACRYSRCTTFGCRHVNLELCCVMCLCSCATRRIFELVHCFHRLTSTRWLPSPVQATRPCEITF